MVYLIARDAKAFFEGITTKKPTVVIVISYEKVCLKSKTAIKNIMKKNVTILNMGRLYEFAQLKHK